MSRLRPLPLALAALVAVQVQFALRDLAAPALDAPPSARPDALRDGERDRVAGGLEPYDRASHPELRELADAFERTCAAVPPGGRLVLLSPDDPVFALAADRLGGLLYPRVVQLVRLPLGAALPVPAAGPPLVALRIGESCAAALPPGLEVLSDGRFHTLLRTKGDAR